MENKQSDASPGGERVRSTIKTRKSAATRKRIMDAASTIMMERGNTAFRMSEISQSCDMSKGALYYYFADKQDLLQAIFDEELHELVVAIDAVVRDEDSAELALRGACAAYAECVRKGGPLAMALVRELVLSQEIDAQDTNQSILHIIDVIARLLERAKVEGKVRADVHAHLAAVAICGAYAFMAMLATNNDEGWEQADYAEEMFDSIVRGVGV